MSKKSADIAARIASFRGGKHDAHYLGYFDCFNRQLFYEAHDVLEELWLADRRGPEGDFYKGLIQLAGAFVHIQKNRPGPAGALFRLAWSNLQKFAPRHLDLDLHHVSAVIGNWQARVEGAALVSGLLTSMDSPKLELEED